MEDKTWLLGCSHLGLLVWLSVSRSLPVEWPRAPEWDSSCETVAMISVLVHLAGQSFPRDTGRKDVFQDLHCVHSIAMR